MRFMKLDFRSNDLKDLQCRRYRSQSPRVSNLLTSSTYNSCREIVVHVNGESSFSDEYGFKCAVAEAKGPRRFMEDAHSVVVPFAGVHGQGFFAIFDGHAGKQAAEWCGQNFTIVRSHSISHIL